jgi:RNA polymerase sigma factor (sigma-70 family)
MATAAPEVSVLARDAAFERMYRRHVKDVYHYALALLRNPADAEDVTQTTFMNAYRAMARGEQPRKPQNWLIKIAHNAARTRYARSTRRVKEVPLEDHVDTIPMPDEEKPDLQEVLEALGRLPLNQRAALVMRELEGRSYAEIADTIGVSVPAVETLIFRARRSLKLKASAVRVLGLVPLPPSLTQLFGGGAVAGGTAALGSGFLLKTAVAVVAGAIATGIGGGERETGAVAAPAGEPIAAPPWTGGTGALTLAGVRTSRTVQDLRTARSQRPGGRVDPGRNGPAAAAAIGEKAGVATAAVPTAGGPGRSVAAPQPATSVATTTVEQVTSTVPVVNQVVPSLPATTPQLPPTPPPPAVPALPPLPSVPGVPGLPPVPGLP